MTETPAGQTITGQARDKLRQMLEKETAQAQQAAEQARQMVTERVRVLLRRTLETDYAVVTALVPDGADALANGVIVDGYVLRIILSDHNDQGEIEVFECPNPGPISSMNALTRRISTFREWAQFVTDNAPVPVGEYVLVSNGYTQQFYNREDYAALVNAPSRQQQPAAMPGPFFQTSGGA